MPGGQFSVRMPHSCTIGLLGIAKFETQTLSLPSTATAHGPGRPPPLNGEPGNCVPLGLSKVTLPSPPFCLDIVLVRKSDASFTPFNFRCNPMSTRCARARGPVPKRLVTQTLPLLSMFKPLLRIPVLKFSVWLAFVAGNRVTLSDLSAT